MNYDKQRMFAHQLLLDGEVFKDLDFGAKDCRLCMTATISRAGEVAGKIVYRDDKTGTDYRPPSVRDVVWDTEEDIVSAFSRAIRVAHSRHQRD